MTTEDQDWISAHIFYQGDLDPLIVRLAGPVTAELTGRGWARCCFFLRYWDGGPHLRLRVLPTQPSMAAEVAGLIRTRAEAFLRDEPSPDLLSDEDYQRSARQLGAWERMRPTEERHPNNTIAFIPYVRETARYGTGERIESVETQFHESSALALGTLGRAPTVAQREMQALAMILLSDHLMREQGLRREPDGTDAWLRLLEHTGGGGAAVLNRSYECQRAQLTTLAAQMGHLVRNRASLPPGAPFVRWVRSLIPLLPTPSGHDGGLDPTSVVDLCTHLMCNRLGVRLEAEGTLRLLAARALTGASADSGTH